jgi:hypothetical protein
MSGANPSGPININLSLHDRIGGHTISNHVAKPEAWLRQRLTSDLTIPAASTFPDLPTAEFAVNQAIQADLGAFNAWLASTTGLLQFDHDVGVNIGTVLRRNCPSGAANPSATTKVRVIVKRLG